MMKSGNQNNNQKFINKITFKDVTFDSKRKNRSRYIARQGIKKPKNICITNSPYMVSVNDDGDVEVRRHQSIYIENSKIKAVYPAGKEKVKQNKADLVYDAGARGGIVITPGFINAHSHPTMYLMRSAMLLDYGQHLDETIAKMPLWQRYITEDALLTSILGDITEQQKSGITSTLNHNAIYKEVDLAADLCNQRIINCVSAISNSMPDVTLERAEKYILAKKREMSIPGIAIHYLYKVDEDLLTKISKLQKKHKVLVTIHFAESEGVARKCVEKFGMRETAILKKHGLLNSLTLLSHVLHVTREEVKELVNSGVGIVHLPTSNAIHKSGAFDYPWFVEYGGENKIALGTDSVVSKSRLDLLTEAFQTRVTHLPDYTVYYEKLFKMITVNAARIVGQQKLGRIAPGYKADIAFWKLKDRGFLPFNENKPESLVGNIISHGGRNIRDLMIDGKFVISNRVHNLVNESKLLVEIQKEHMRVREKVEKEKLKNK